MSILEKMSTADLMENLREELTCFICLDYFKSPVTTECGHSFCLMCLLKNWEEHKTPLSCPECWRTLGGPHFQPNERLGRLASIGRLLRSQVLQCEDDLSNCGRMVAATRILSDDEQSITTLSTQSHGINRVHLSSEAEDQHKVRQAVITLRTQMLFHPLAPSIYCISNNHGSSLPATTARLVWLLFFLFA